MTDPRPPLVALICLATLVVVIEQAPGLLLLTALSGLILVTSGGDRRLVQAAALGGLGLLWSTMLAQGLFYDQVPRLPAARMGPLTLWAEGLRHGAVQSLRVIAITWAGVATTLRLPPWRVLQGLHALRVPWALAFLVATTLRLLPSITTEWLSARELAQRRRPMASPPRPARLRQEVELLRPVLARSIRRALILAEALDARGWDPGDPPTDPLPPLSSAQALACAAMVMATCAAIAARVSFALYTSGTWYDPALRPVYAAVRTWM